MRSNRLEIKEIFRQPDMTNTINEINLESDEVLDVVDGIEILERRCLRQKRKIR